MFLVPSPAIVLDFLLQGHGFCSPTLTTSPPKQLLSCVSFSSLLRRPCKTRPRRWRSSIASSPSSRKPSSCRRSPQIQSWRRLGMHSLNQLSWLSHHREFCSKLGLPCLAFQTGMILPESSSASLISTRPFFLIPPINLPLRFASHGPTSLRWPGAGMLESKLESSRASVTRHRRETSPSRAGPKTASRR